MKTSTKHNSFKIQLGQNSQIISIRKKGKYWSVSNDDFVTIQKGWHQEAKLTDKAREKIIRWLLQHPDYINAGDTYLRYSVFARFTTENAAISFTQLLLSLSAEDFGFGKSLVCDPVRSSDFAIDLAIMHLHNSGVKDYFDPDINADVLVMPFDLNKENVRKVLPVEAFSKRSYKKYLEYMSWNKGEIAASWLLETFKPRNGEYSGYALLWYDNRLAGLWQKQLKKVWIFADEQELLK